MLMAPDDWGVVPLAAGDALGEDSAVLAVTVAVAGAEVAVGDGGIGVRIAGRAVAVGGTEVGVTAV